MKYFDLAKVSNEQLDKEVESGENHCYQSTIY